MVGEIRLAGFTLTADEWDGLDAETREELLGVAAPGDDDPDEPDVRGGASDVVW
jgi:hypothetical protein